MQRSFTPVWVGRGKGRIQHTVLQLNLPECQVSGGRRRWQGILTTLYGRLFAHKLQISPSHWRGSPQAQLATLAITIAYSRWGIIALLTLGFGLTSPKPLEKPSWLYIPSQWLHTPGRTRLQRETRTFTACGTDASLPCSAVGTVFAIARWQRTVKLYV